ncbi:hypothetical protein [Endozoicomonas euniceicola]|uniref:RES domain-containing protein n=1 Tax=Endozoicomonas euniceicola TaxID=1234143 RepID=A0ABY6H211_9GAMM|nr:hypothetical protein [Endozoicomonas euniceicola]UYM18639.1 hypothetical protein NX720_12295 [Endozoicomonas euniceicola]
MPDPRLKAKDIFTESNRLLLTRSPFFQDTTKIEGARFATSIREGRRLFYGYVYYRSVSDKEVPYLFENGISTAMYDVGSGKCVSDEKKVPGKTYGYPLTDVSTLVNLRRVPWFETYVCHYQARCVDPDSSSVCLIDIRELGGVVRSELWSGKTMRDYINNLPHYLMDDEAFARFPISEKILGVVIMYPVSKSRIVGVIKTFPFSNRSLHSQKLKLYVNPNYTGGMEGARAVAASFNRESEWLMVDA